MKKVAVVGIVGVPANYGGFETLVENLIEESNSNDIQFTVYCSFNAYPEKKDRYKNAILKYIKLDANGMQSIIYDIVSLVKATRHNDTILILGVSGCSCLPLYRFFSKKKLVVNIDGLEHKRDKWNRWIKMFLKFSEKMAVKYADVVVTDNKGISDYVIREYASTTEVIEYGGDHVKNEVSEQETMRLLKKYDLQSNLYSFALCRIEPENNVHTILNAFKNLKEQLVFVGNWHRSEYGKSLLLQYSGYPNIMLLQPIYDLEILHVLRSNCKFYIHGHSAGGTNPSLVEAMFFRKPILAFDVIYNRETTEYNAHYFSSAETLIELVNKSYDSFDINAQSMAEIAQKRYTWRIIAEKYAVIL